MKKLITILLVWVVHTAWSQQQISGIITDRNNEPLLGANIVEKGTTNGVSTGIDGDFSLNVGFDAVIVVSFTGYETQEIAVNGKSNFTIILEEGMELSEVVITGNRAKPRTILDSPVPIDNIGVGALQSSGKPTFERMLVFTVPSFNAQNQAISDATAHFDPADLRGLGPSRTLVLVNGKRKNQSAQLYLNRTPGKGEVGIDLKSIPVAAIDRVEVLRDGASAQYGSDAIAGVLNIILKKDAKFSSFSAQTGITSEGDGFNFATDFNSTLKIGEGFLNVTLGYYKQQITNRAGSPGITDLPENPRDEWKKWAEENPTLSMKVGQPELEKKDLFVNFEHPLTPRATLYSFHGYTHRTGKSFAYYRAPYWRTDVADSAFLTKKEDFIGYQPTFETEVNDHLNAVGVRFDFTDKWKGDVSGTYGSNSAFYTINNTVNRDYLKDHKTSPRSFRPGGYQLQNIIGNFDVSGLITDNISLAVGAEIKKEYFTAYEGDPLSYYKGGSDSFAGIKPEEAGQWSRSNFAGYAQLDYDITKNLLLGVAGRYENFTDAGDNFSWKVNGRYKIFEKGAIRASYSTGFRAPTLHQQKITISQYIIVSGSIEPLLQGTLANDNPAVQGLGVPKLTFELSRNISAGLTYQINRNFFASLDVYQINVDNRVLFSSQIGSDSDETTVNPVEKILKDNNVTAVQFFINAGNTKTLGGDLVLSYRNIRIGNTSLSATLSANFNKNTIDAVKTPNVLAQNNYDIFDRREKGLIVSARPQSKIILGLDYNIKKWNFTLNNTRFGEVTISSETGSDNDQVLSPKITTDLGIKFMLSDKISFNGKVNNIFDVYPDKSEAKTGVTANGRFPYSFEVQQLGQLGRNFSLGVNMNF